MLKRLMERRKEEGGFTLIELMVVVLIIGILIAIALPTFLGARARAQDRAAQSGLRNGIAAAKTLYTDKDAYVGTGTGGAVTVADLQAIEPSLTWQTGASTGPKVISYAVSDVTTGDHQVFGEAAKSDSGTCFYLKTVEAGSGAGTFFGKDTSPTATCDGTTALTAATGASF